MFRKYKLALPKYPWTLNRWTKVTVQVIDVDEYSQKISLSLRTLEDKVHSVNHRRKKYFTDKNKNWLCNLRQRTSRMD